MTPGRVLLVEDDERSAELIRLTLEPHGADLMRARSLEEARALIAAALPDVILLDLDLPLISGLDVLTSVKTSRDLRSIPVVVLVRSPRREDVEECYERGANSVVEYPIPLEQLAETVRRVVLYWGRLNLRERRDGLTT